MRAGEGRTRLLPRLAAIAALALALTPAPGRAETVPPPGVETAPPAAFAGATFLLPLDTGVTAHWILPPTETWRDATLGLNEAGDPLFVFEEGLDGSRLVDPMRGYGIRLARKITQIVRLDRGVTLFAADNVLGSLAPAEGGLDDEGYPHGALQPLIRAPLRSIEAVAAAGDTLFLAGADPATGRHQVFRLQSLPGGGPLDLVLVHAGKAAVTALAADAGAVYIATGQDVLRLDRVDGSVSSFYRDPAEPVTGLAVLPEALAVSTGKALILATARGALRVMASQGHSIVARDGTLYVLFGRSLGVLAIEHLGDLAPMALSPRPALPDELPQPLTLAATAAFAIGPGEGDAAVYGDSFDRTSVRRLGIDIALRLPAGSDAAGPFTVTTTWRGPEGAVLAVDTAVASAAPDGVIGLTAGLGGKTEHGYAPPHWLHRFHYTDELAGGYPGTYRAEIAVDGVPVGSATIELTGDPTPELAIDRDDLPALRALLKAGLDPNARIDNRPLLSEAVLFGTADAVKLLLEKGASVKATDDDGATALATLFGIFIPPDWRAKADLLIARKAGVNALSRSDGLPLIFSAAETRPEAVIYLINKGARTAAPADARESLMALAVEWPGMCDKALLQLLLKKGAKLNAVLDGSSGKVMGYTPLGDAIARARPDCVALLLALGASTRLAQHWSLTPDRSALGLALEPFADPAHAPTADERRVVALLRAQGARLADNEAAAMFAGNAPLLFDMGELAAALDREPPVDPTYLVRPGLMAALRARDPAIRDMALDRAARLVREMAAAAVDDYTLSPARMLCRDLLPALEADYAPRALTVPAAALSAAELAQRQPGGGAYLLRPGGEGSAAGLLPGDIVTGLDGVPIADPGALKAAAEAGGALRLTLLRDDPIRRPAITLGCGLVVHTMRDETGPIAANLAHWLAVNAGTAEAAGIEAALDAR